MNDYILANMQQAEYLLDKKNLDSTTLLWVGKYLELAKVTVGNPDLKLFERTSARNAELEELQTLHEAQLKHMNYNTNRMVNQLQKTISFYEESGTSEENASLLKEVEKLRGEKVQLIMNLRTERDKPINYLVGIIDRQKKKISLLKEKNLVVPSRKPNPRKKHADSRRTSQN